MNSLRKRQSVDPDPLDRALRQSLKFWSSRVHPPSDAAGKLLWEAARVTPGDLQVDVTPPWSPTLSRPVYMEDHEGLHGIVAHALVHVFQLNIVSVI